MKKIVNKLSWVIGGPQGTGVDTAANIFARAGALGGLHVYGKREYFSNIKGEHSYFVVGLSEKLMRASVDNLDLLAAFDTETVFTHALYVKNGGGIVYDTALDAKTLDDAVFLNHRMKGELKAKLTSKNLPVTVRGILDLAKQNGAQIYGMAFADIIKEVAAKVGETSHAKLARMINVLALSASFGILDYDLNLLARAIRFAFKSKPKVADMNVDGATLAYNQAKKQFSDGFKFKLEPREVRDDLILVSGAQATGLGKIVGGCRLQTYYPITPASDESEFLESNQIIDLEGGEKGSCVVVQMEDEIAAIASAIGATLTGTRAATCTSGPGFSLMAEALGWAGINEVPVVVTLYQRGGPSTGLPTRHEQGDLKFAISAGHGEFPRIVFASGDVEESFYDAAKAFDFAERYQTPVIHLVDKALANNVMTCPVFEPKKLKLDRGALVDKPEPGYLRFKLTETGISPRIRLGTANAVFWNTGDESEESGHITEDPVIRDQMMEKRMGKLTLVLKELPTEEKVLRYGHDSQYTVISWGSPKGAILDAMEILEGEGIKINFVQLRLLHPFPAREVEALLKNTKTLIDIEMNYSGQLGSLIRENVKIDPDYYVVKYNGRPMSTTEVYTAIRKVIDGKASKREVLTHGA